MGWSMTPNATIINHKCGSLEECSEYWRRLCKLMKLKTVKWRKLPYLGHILRGDWYYMLDWSILKLSRIADNSVQLTNCRRMWCGARRIWLFGVACCVMLSQFWVSLLIYCILLSLLVIHLILSGVWSMFDTLMLDQKHVFLILYLIPDYKSAMFVSS